MESSQVEISTNAAQPLLRVDRLEISEAMPLLATQRPLWLGQELDAGSRAFNIGGYTTLKGPLDVPTFAAAVAACIGESQALRLRFSSDENGPFQKVSSEAAVKLRVLDFSCEVDPSATAMTWIQHEMETEMDLAAGKTFSWTLLRLAPDHSIFCVVYHHIVCDGLSSMLLVRRIRQLYQAFKHGIAPRPGNFATMASLVEAEHAYRMSDGFAADRRYWLGQLQECPPALSLSRIKSRAITSHSRCESITLASGVVDELLARAAQLKTTLPRLLTGSIGIIVHRLSAASDFLIGLVVAGRSGPSRNTPANLMHVLPLRFQFDEDSCIADAIRDAATRMEGANAHKLYQMDDIRRDLGLRPNHSSLFTIEVNIMPFLSTDSEDSLDWTTRCVALGPVAGLTVSIPDRDDDGRLTIALNGNKELFNELELKQLSARFDSLLHEIAAKPVGAKLADINVMNVNERQQIIESFNRTSAGVTPDCLPDLLDAQVARTPGALALTFGDVRLTYGELDGAANRMARALIARGIGPESIVGLLLPRSPELVISMLAILKAGGAYLPMDIDHPADRLQGMVHDSGANLLVTTSGVRARMPFMTGLPLMVTDDAGLQQELAAMPAGKVRDAERITSLQPDHLLYTIYTSGSTGQPKGVAIEHRSFTVFLQAIQSQVQIRPEDVLLAITTISFDIAGLEIFLPLMQGASIAMLNGADSRDPNCAVAAANRLGVSVVQATPTFWRALLSCGMPRQVRVLIGGEALPGDMVPQLLEFSQAINLYGPTETTVWSSSHILTVEDLDAGPVVTIGRPLNEQKFYILDENLAPVPVGAIGELYIAGAGLARGYLNRPQLTSERFVNCPFGVSGERMYRTGDLAQWRKDGQVDFLGRADQQVKIRGFRIEPGEIEAALAQLIPAIKECVVVARQIRGQAQLVAYYTTVVGSRIPDTREIRTGLGQSLPDYMVPVAYVRMEKMPLTANAKLDRRALPQPEAVEDRSVFVPPATPAEAAICEVFAEFTRAPRVGRDDDFFELGGHSLAAVLCVHRLRRVLGCDVQLRQLFESPTPATLARATGRRQPGRPIDSSTQDLNRRVVFLLPGVGGDAPRLVRFRSECEGTVKIVTLEYPDWTLLGDRENSVDVLVDSVVSQIEREMPAGPIWMLGYSFGGYCAHAVAMHLTKAGREVGFVGLLDTSALPNLPLILSAQMQDGLSPWRAVGYAIQDLGRLLRVLTHGEAGKTTALIAVRWLTLPLARPLLALAARFRHKRLPLRFGYHLHFFFDESRRVAAVKHWYGMVVNQQPLPPSIPAYLFRSQEHAADDPEDLGWSRYFQTLTVLHQTGNHETMFDPPHLKSLCEQTRRVMNEISQGTKIAESYAEQVAV